MMFKTALLIGLGGALGSIARYAMNQSVTKAMSGGFPWGTLSINVLGSLLIGIIAGLLAFTSSWSQELRAFLIVGILGGFTTFSAFSLDANLLFEKHQLASFLLYVGGSVCLSLLATGGGLYLVKVLT